MISIEEFKRIELKIGKVEKVEEIPNSKNLYKLLVDFGNEKRQIVSGIKRYYSPTDLEGKQFVFITNLEPAKIMGEVSEGMILAAVDGDKLALLKPTEAVGNGTRIS